MKYAPSLVFAALVVPALFPYAAYAQALSINAAQKVRLVSLVKNEAEARALFAPLQKNAPAALSDTPDPVESIVSEGTLAADPRKIRTRKSLRDMGKMEALAWAGAVTGQAKYAEKARAFVLAWAKTNKPSGNPINETKLEPLFVAYDLTKAGFAPDERKTVETYLRRVAEAEQNSIKPGKGTAQNNWHSHRIKIVGLIGFVLSDAALSAWAKSAYQKQIATNLRPDGSSMDFEDRDALHYHVYDVEPLLSVAQAARQSDGANWYNYQSPSKTSLAQSVAFLAPYATGEKTHAEFVGSKVAFDKKRAEAGEKGYQAGTLFEPTEARRVFERALVWQPSYTPLALMLAFDRKTPAKRFGSWQMVVQEARR